MDAEGLRERASAGMAREGRTSVLFGAYVLFSLLLIAVWGAAGAGYFWPTWPIAAGAFVFGAVALVQAWPGRHAPAETSVSARVAQLSGGAPPGIQR
jgi:hypothetical protein